MIKKIDATLVTEMGQSAQDSSRLRSHHNFHPTLTDSVNRLCIFLKHGTYIRPHRHSEAHKWELIIALKGQTGIVIYDARGQITDKFVMAPNSTMIGFEIEPNTWHSLYAITDEAMFFEVKPGPFSPTPQCDFAYWAPKEGECAVEQFLMWQTTAYIGEKYGVSSNDVPD
ncbi:WbuC family cupin fold metalloprotein [Caedibacter taeniospiralis]|jgi:cupin fold WbuC family metalloprotein|uniref:WbuC family cupin fold metalloprotein n=1 Tax=Caedibacter taeniospiralis TaxID=28907 RepID=UPI0037C1A5F7